jgi:ornithine cyclodeaminase/alanine dehydrogenase-like protein (mu-crystallin family)
MSDALPFITGEQIAALVSPGEAVEAIVDALRDVDPADDPPRSVIDVGTGQLLLMPSASDAAIGVKLATVAPDNPAAGLPRIHAVYALFDARTLAPIAVLDGAALTTLRTPAVSVAAVRPALLARADAPRVVVFGAGPQGVGHVAALSALVDLADVSYIVRHPQGRDRMLAAGSDEALAVLRAADVVVCATAARTPLFDSTLLTDDAIVVAVGSHEPDARELDSALMGRAQVIVEDVATALRECGDVVLAIADGDLSHDALVAMRDMVIGTATPSADRPIVFKGSGMAWQDLAVATRIQVASVRRRTGTGDTTSLPG